MKREVISVPDVPRPVLGAQAVKAGHLVFLGGQLAFDGVGGVPPEARQDPRFPFFTSRTKLQSRVIMRNIRRLLEAAGTAPDQGVRIDQFFTARRESDPYFEVRKLTFDEAIRPASTAVPVEGFPVAGTTVQVGLIATTPGDGARKEPVMTDRAPIPLRGPQGARAGDWVFLTGVVASDFKSGVAPEAKVNPDLWYGSNLKLQAQFCLRQLEAILQGAGSSLRRTVKAQVYLTDMADFCRLEEVWQEFFPADPPARTVIPVRELGFVGCMVEINLIALTDGSRLRREPIHAPGVPRGPLHQPQAMRAGDLVFLSGLYATDFVAARVPEAVAERTSAAGGALQAEVILGAAEAVCRAAGSSLEQAVWAQAFMDDLREFPGLADVWGRRLGDPGPAALVVGVPGPQLVPECSLVMDLTAAIPG